MGSMRGARMKNKLKQIYQAWDRIGRRDGKNGNDTVFVFGTVAFIVLIAVLIVTVFMVTLKYAPWVFMVGFVICIMVWLGTLAKLAWWIVGEMKRSNKE
jgi:hypothetical protein